MERGLCIIMLCPLTSEKLCNSFRVCECNIIALRHDYGKNPLWREVSRQIVTLNFCIHIHVHAISVLLLSTLARYDLPRTLTRTLTRYNLFHLRFYRLMFEDLGIVRAHVTTLFTLLEVQQPIVCAFLR